MSTVEILGWASSVILVITLAFQVRKQWKEQTSKGVSTWLYFGQLAAQTGFVIYSFLLQSWVFLFTNLTLMVISIVGGVLLIRHRGWRAAFRPE